MLCLEKVRAAYARLLKLGFTDALRTLHPNEVIYTFWDYLRFAWQRNAQTGLDHFCLINIWPAGLKKAGLINTYVAGKKQAIMRRHGLS